MLVRVIEPGRPGFQLRSGETGISVFDSEAVDPPLTEEEILQAFRAGSGVVLRSQTEVEALGLQIVPLAGGESLPQRLRHAHAEIRPGAGVTRVRFKAALKELE